MKGHRHQVSFLVVEDSVEITVSEDDTDNIPCCICNQRYPPILKHVVSLTIVNWAQCENTLPLLFTSKCCTLEIRIQMLPL